MLFNIGYKESLKFDQYDGFIFHDIDLRYQKIIAMNAVFPPHLDISQP